LSKARPRLADVQCSRMQFQPGDRVLVKVHLSQPMTREDERRVRKMVERWAGDYVEVLVIDTTLMEVTKLGQEEQPGIIYPGSS